MNVADLWVIVTEKEITKTLCLWHLPIHHDHPASCVRVEWCQLKTLACDKMHSLKELMKELCKGFAIFFVTVKTGKRLTCGRCISTSLHATEATYGD